MPPERAATTLCDYSAPPGDDPVLPDDRPGDAAWRAELVRGSAWTGRKTDSVSDFLGERVGQKTQKQGGDDLTDICKIQFLMAGTRRLVLLGRRARVTVSLGKNEKTPWRDACL